MENYRRDDDGYLIVVFDDSRSEDSDTSSESSDSERCDHCFDGGECLECHVKTMCELCDENPWETRCDICNAGMICDDCYVRCEKCDQKVCVVCGECDCDE